MELFDIDQTFGDDYLYFYGSFLDEDRSRADVGRIVDVLDVDGGDRVLDAPCGHGRIANLLAADGIAVTGIDRSERFVEMARTDAADRNVDVDYRVGDLRDLPVDGPFDAAVCWFTSFGYFDDADNRAVLAEYARVLAPGGRLGIEMIHHDGFVRGFTPAPFSTKVERGDDAMIDTTSFDPVTGRSVTDRVVYRRGAVRRTRHQVRLPTIPEFRAWLAEAGFSDVRVRGAEDAPPTVDDMRIVVVAVR